MRTAWKLLRPTVRFVQWTTCGREKKLGTVPSSCIIVIYNHIEATGLTPVDQLAVTQPHCAEVSDASPCRVMQQHRVRRFRRNPHAASRTVLLEMNFIHRPKVDVFVSCQPAEFFLPGPDPRGWHWQSPASVFAGETRVAGRVAGTAGFPGSRPIASSHTRIGSSRPTGFLSARSPSAACAAPRQYPGYGPCSIVSGDQIAPPRSGRSVHRVQTDGSNMPPFAAHPPATLRLDDNSCPGQRVARRGGDGHIEIPRNGGFHPAAQVQRFQHLLSLVASCHQNITGMPYGQLLMTLCIIVRGSIVRESYSSTMQTREERS